MYTFIQVETMEKKKERLLTIKFNADTAAQMRCKRFFCCKICLWADTRSKPPTFFNRWNFRPQQPVVMVHPGETALAFYTARNPTEKYVPSNCELFDGNLSINSTRFQAHWWNIHIQCHTIWSRWLITKYWYFLFNFAHLLSGQYFNKIQCFCFEEQRLNPGEEVHLNISKIPRIWIYIKR